MTDFGDYLRFTSEGTISNTYECPKKSSKWPENNNKINKVATVNVVAVVNNVGIKVAGATEDAVEAGGVAEEEVRADYHPTRSKALLSSPSKPRRPFWWRYYGFSTILPSLSDSARQLCKGH